MQIYKGIGTEHCGHEELIDFLNYVFGMNGARQGFYRLLPKLYRPMFRPEDYNFIVTEDERLRGAVGSYPIELTVCGEKLCAMGIGNVAVHPFHRGKGYMKDCMGMAMADMLQRGVDFSVLGGRRQRYSYFGFEPAGICAKFTVDSDNLLHAFGSRTNQTGYAARLLGAEDVSELGAISALAERSASHAVRSAERLYDVLTTWESKVYAVTDETGAFAGYFLATDAVSEIDCISEDKAKGVLVACYEAMAKEELALRVPFHSAAMFELLADVAENCETVKTENYNVFHYEKVIRACLNLKAGYAPLADGEITLHIDGYAGEEKIRIAVKDGKPTVGAACGDCDVRYTHRQAMTVLFGLYAKERKALPGYAAGWLPLPLFVPEVDNV